MPIFDPAASSADIWPSDSIWPRLRAERLLARFAMAYPGIDYGLAWDVDAVNAQAFLAGGRRNVRLYGGLARHRRIGLGGLAFVLAHETGHLLGGAPTLPGHRWLSSEERASDWARTEGVPTVFGPNAARLLARARLELAAVEMANVR